MSAEMGSEEGLSGQVGVLGRLRHLILVGEFGPVEWLIDEQVVIRPVLYG